MPRQGGISKELLALNVVTGLEEGDIVVMEDRYGISMYSVMDPISSCCGDHRTRCKCFFGYWYGDIKCIEREKITKVFKGELK